MVANVGSLRLVEVFFLNYEHFLLHELNFGKLLFYPCDTLQHSLVPIIMTVVELFLNRANS